MKLIQEIIHSIDHIDSKQWNQLNTLNNPFLDHRFFHLLESTGCTSKENGWQPNHLSWRDENEVLQAVMPMYLKNHSYGEYMFDWNWADGIQRAGINYYPKVVAAVPFSPISGNRLLLSTELQSDPNIRSELLKTVFKSIDDQQISNLQALYIDEAEIKQWQVAGAMLRNGYQFSWYNGDKTTPYQSFDDYLAILNSKTRKSIKRERRLIHETDVEFYRKTADSSSSDPIKEDDWQFFIKCYQQTYLKRSGHIGYLSPEFFHQLRASMPEYLLLVIAKRNNQKIAASLFIIGDNILYGRYWGALEEIDGLHFECCYYQAIDYCIEQNIHCFQPGTQGDYKRRRGFVAERVFGAYYFTNKELRSPIGHYLKDEIETLGLQFEQWRQSSPVKIK